MLIDKGCGVGDIVTLKLTSGDEVIAKLVEETDKYIKISRPLALAASRQGIGMVQYLYTVDPDREIKISRNSVMIFEPTESEVVKQYIQTTTNISLA